MKYLPGDFSGEQVPRPNASLLEVYALATDETRALIRGKLYPDASPQEFERWIARRQPWQMFGRQEQLEPPGDWFIWLYQAGRGAGKTKSGVEWVWKRVHLWDKHLAHVVSPTVDDHDKVTFDGPSGLMRLVDRYPHRVAKVNRRPWSIEFRNGSKILSFSAEAPERLRGPQCHTTLIDEGAGMGKRLQEVMTQASFGLRLNGPRGQQPRMAITSTPKPMPTFIQLNERFAAGDKSVVITRGSMMDNAANLSAMAIAELRGQYEGTRLGEQELYGKLLTDIPGALWTASSIVPASVPERLDRIVIGVDPSGAADPNSTSDEIGIVAAGVIYGKTKAQDRFYILQDSTLIDSPDKWAKEAVKLYKAWLADRVVAESNFGGAMVEATIRSVDPNISLRLTTSSRGKVLRAEPVAALYEQGRVWHCGNFHKLVGQMCAFTSSGYVGDASPDRVDAMVFAMTDLMTRDNAPLVAAAGGNRISNWKGS